MAALQDKERKINVHEQRIACLEGKSKVSKSTTLKCDHCEYESTSTTALKSHMTKKHKTATNYAVVSTSPMLTQLDGRSEDEYEECITTVPAPGPSPRLATTCSLCGIKGYEPG